MNSIRIGAMLSRQRHYVVVDFLMAILMSAGLFAASAALV
jgi:hypothetical protein